MYRVFGFNYGAVLNARVYGIDFVLMMAESSMVFPRSFVLSICWTLLRSLFLMHFFVFALLILCLLSSLL